MKAAKVRTLIINEFKKVFLEVDALITPVSPEVAWKI
jgi:Asp-tRNA(Asn)/Glu-tRNA(Gln) amidotransferase A subunit family amidase